MARPKKNRLTKCNPGAFYYKPQGIPLRELETVVLEEDELEAINLADNLLYSHEDGSVKMKISRATFGRILRTARSKIAESLISGKAIELKNKRSEK